MTDRMIRETCACGATCEVTSVQPFLLDRFRDAHEACREGFAAWASAGYLSAEPAGSEPTRGSLHDPRDFGVSDRLLAALQEIEIPIFDHENIAVCTSCGEPEWPDAVDLRADHIIDLLGEYGLRFWRTTDTVFDEENRS